MIVQEPTTYCLALVKVDRPRLALWSVAHERLALRVGQSDIVSIASPRPSMVTTWGSSMYVVAQMMVVVMEVAM
jgi:hypothetical protein